MQKTIEELADIDFYQKAREQQKRAGRNFIKVGDHVIISSWCPYKNRRTAGLIKIYRENDKLFSSRNDTSNNGRMYGDLINKRSYKIHGVIRSLIQPISPELNKILQLLDNFKFGEFLKHSYYSSNKEEGKLEKHIKNYVDSNNKERYMSIIIDDVRSEIFKIYWELTYGIASGKIK